MDNAYLTIETVTPPTQAQLKQIFKDLSVIRQPRRPPVIIPPLTFDRKPGPYRPLRGPFLAHVNRPGKWKP